MELIWYFCLFKNLPHKIYFLANTIMTINDRGKKRMDANRVKQILSSSADIEVQYNGVSVWIDKLHEDGKTATVELRGPLEERSEVDISELKEF